MRRDRLEAHIEAALPDWSLAPVVRALQALRGMALVAAATVIAELGDITRFANPRQLMAYLGLVPSEHSSGATRRQGGITKAGNSAARRMLIEAAWSYKFPARISREQLLRQERVWRSRSATPRGRRKNGYVGAIASSPGQENHLQWSPPQSLENWRPLPGRSLNTFKPLTLDALRSIADITKRRSSPTTIYPKLSKAGGTVTARRTLASTISRIVSDAGPLDRGSSATHHRSGGIQPAHQSLINRRFDDRASCPAQSRPF